METLYWFCNECDDISSSHICKCQNSWKCPNCSVVSKIEDYTNNSHQFIECSTCGFCKRTIIGVFPDNWVANIAEHKITLTYNLDHTRDLNYHPDLNYQRTIVVEITIDNIDNLLNGSCFDSLTINDQSTDFLTLYEQYFIYSLLVSYFPYGPEHMEIQVFVNYILNIERFSTNLIANEELPGFLRDVDIYIRLYIRFSIVSTITQGLFSENGGNNNATQLQVVMTRSLNERKPMYAASSKSLSSVKDTEICFKDILLEECKSDVTFNKSCPICMDDFTATISVIKQKCCNNLLHSKCLMKWLSKCNHVCPICRFAFEKDKDSIAKKATSSASSEESAHVDAAHVDAAPVDAGDSSSLS